ncbi:hypothetical protein C8F04DRAFT_1191275 [Mycena alexandri]|uniref:Uncharacterized protein n=1 Tax=Mycena alexandri TaxID=1745969 RepID=A0AAD6SD40_9AGAR|nr:hypothetical protein C8F04DRAFT_1191275 [Mycena alexandri]
MSATEGQTHAEARFELDTAAYRATGKKKVARLRETCRAAYPARRKRSVIATIRRRPRLLIEFSRSKDGGGMVEYYRNGIAAGRRWDPRLERSSSALLGGIEEESSRGLRVKETNSKGEETFGGGGCASFLRAHACNGYPLSTVACIARRSIVGGLVKWCHTATASCGEFRPRKSKGGDSATFLAAVQLERCKAAESFPLQITPRRTPAPMLCKLFRLRMQRPATEDHKMCAYHHDRIKSLGRKDVHRVVLQCR